ncbi:calcium/sodium antiporter [Candidatus Parcubacteria bacterium]|nr:calcium/sodium antiporter [Candidatus Parcubacteria bacterium]
MLITWLIVLIFSLYVLTKAADYFTDVSEKVGSLLKLPDFVTGVLIVALGTSLPELVTSIFGVISGKAEILAANVTGSTVANILLGLGLVVVVTWKIAKFNWDSVSNDMPFLLGATILLILTVLDGKFQFYEAIVFLTAYIIYVFYSLRIKKMNRKEIRDDLKREIKARRKKEVDEQFPTRGRKTTLKLIVGFIISLAFIIIAAKYTVDSLIQIATMLGLATSALAASLVAIGTSLPEISVGISSARKGNFDMVIGNIMGSNIFNILVVFGIVGLFTTVPVSNDVLYLIIPMMCGAILVQWLVTMDKKITITEGMLMTILYITFIAKLFNIF